MVCHMVRIILMLEETAETRCNGRGVLCNEPHEYHSILPAILHMWGIESDSYMNLPFA
jgi:hypothetical protein